jgi:hypothetical protein
MPEGTKTPLWVKRVLLVVSIVGPAMAAITTVSMSIIDIRSKARRASQEAEAGYETLAPAVGEIQSILAEEQNWAAGIDESLDSAEDRLADQERRIIRLEAYIEILGERRNLPAPPPEPAAMSEDSGERRAKKSAPMRPVPTDLGKAKTYQQKRDKLRCNPNDPLCGAIE